MGQIFVRASRRAKAHTRNSSIATFRRAHSLREKVYQKVMSGSTNNSSLAYKKTLQRRYNTLGNIRNDAEMRINKKQENARRMLKKTRNNLFFR